MTRKLLCTHVCSKSMLNSANLANRLSNMVCVNGAKSHAKYVLVLGVTFVGKEANEGESQTKSGQSITLSKQLSTTAGS
jgi:hypothetical protein